jgi:hypothetical protein
MQRNKDIGFFTKLSAFEGIEMKITVPRGVAVHDFGFRHTLPDHPLGHLLIVRTGLLLIFALHADGLVVVYGEYPFGAGFHGGTASLAFQSAA